jgi:enoyl-CoA hydratase
MDYKNLILEKEEKIAIVFINRPEKLNALNKEILDELRNIFTELENDDEVYCVVLTGSGEKAFVAGADISELNKLDTASGKEFAENGQQVFNLIENFDKPVIAAVNGFALGGGCEMSLACHIRFASENAKFSQPEISLGIIPGFGGTQRLPRLINKGRAMEHILSGEMIDAHEALKIGLVNKVYPQPELLPAAKSLAIKISSKGQRAIRLAMKAVNFSGELSLKEGQNYEASLFALCCGTEDFKEGTAAFLEKRKPQFRNK